MMVLHLRFLHLFGGEQKSFFRKYHRNLKISKNKKSHFLKIQLVKKELYPKKNWFKKFEDYWLPSEENAFQELKKFINDKIIDYSESRNYPNIFGTSKLSPFIKHGQLHVETIWEECTKIKKKETSKFLAEIGWREFNHSLINYFPYMLKGNYSKNLIGFLGLKIQNF